MTYSPKEIIGKQVTVLTNLVPRTLRGVESQGMLLMAEDSSGKPIIISPDQGATNGQTIL